MSRPLLIGSLLTLFVATAADGARAALFLAFSGTQGAPGAVVIVQTGGEGSLPGIAEGSPPLRVFLAPVDQASAITSPNDSRLTLLGRLRVNEAGNGSLRFTIPHVPPGDYATLTHCVPCAKTSAGRELLQTGPFPGPFVVLEAGSGESFPTLLVMLGVGAAVLVLGVTARWVFLRRRAEPSAT